MANREEYLQVLECIISKNKSVRNIAHDYNQYFVENMRDLYHDADEFILRMPNEYRHLLFADEKVRQKLSLKKIYSFSYINKTPSPVFKQLLPISEIEPFSFCRCDELTSVEIHATKEIIIREDAFYECNNLDEIKIVCLKGTNIHVDPKIKAHIKIQELGGTETKETKKDANKQNDNSVFDFTNSDSQQIKDNSERIALLQNFYKTAQTFVSQWSPFQNANGVKKVKIAVANISSGVRPVTSQMEILEIKRKLLESLEFYPDEIVYKEKDAIKKSYSSITSLLVGNIFTLAVPMRTLVCPDNSGLNLEEKLEQFTTKLSHDSNREEYINRNTVAINLLENYVGEIQKLCREKAIDLVSYDFTKSSCVVDLSRITSTLLMLKVERKQEKYLLESLLIYMFVLSHICAECHEKTEYAHKKQLLVAKAVAFCAQMDWLKEQEDAKQLYINMSMHSILGDVTFWPQRAYLHLKKHLSKKLSYDDVLKMLIEKAVDEPSAAYIELCRLSNCKPLKTIEEYVDELDEIEDGNAFKEKMRQASDAVITEYYKDDRRALKAFKELDFIPGNSFKNHSRGQVIVGNNIRVIENEAFTDCKNLEELTITNNDTCIIEAKAFINCPKLARIKLLGKGIYTIMPFAFCECAKTIDIKLENTENGLDETSACCFACLQQKININGTAGKTPAERKRMSFLVVGNGSKTFPSGLTCVEGKPTCEPDEPLTYYSFFKRSQTIIDFSDYRGEVKAFAFFKCDQLEEIIIGEKTKVNASAFYGCSNLKTVVFIDRNRGESFVDSKAFRMCAPFEIQVGRTAEKKKNTRLSKYKMQQFDYYRKESADPIPVRLFNIDKKALLLDTNMPWLINKTLSDLYDKISETDTIKYFFSKTADEKCCVNILGKKATDFREDTEYRNNAEESFDGLCSRYTSIFRKKEDALEKDVSRVLKKAKSKTGMETYAILKKELYDHDGENGLRSKLISQGKTELMAMIDEVLQYASELDYKRYYEPFVKYDAENNHILLNLYVINKKYGISGITDNIFEHSMSELLKGYVLYLMLHNGTQKKEYVQLIEGLAECIEYYYAKDELKNKNLAAMIKDTMNRGVYPSWPGGLYQILNYQCYGDDEQTKLMVQDLMEMIVKDMDKAYETVEGYYRTGSLY